MNNHTLTLDQLRQMHFPPIIIYAAPVMFLLVFLEWGLSYRQKKDTYNKKDFWASTAIGIGNIIVSAILKLALFAVILFFYNMVPWRIPPTWWSYIICILAIDFCRYWAHRVAHEQRFWWATHVPHHSSEHYNFSVSFRLSWVQHIKVVFFIPVALMGFNPVVFFICNQIEVLYQFWIHTEYIHKLPKPIEYIFTTPSHHRVHHGSDDKYLDKNYGSTLIIWDRIFGTFQPEEERPTYGITKPVNSYNPVFLVFHEFKDIVADLRHAKNLKQCFRILFSKPGTLVTEHQRRAAEEAAKKEVPEENKLRA